MRFLRAMDIGVLFPRHPARRFVARVGEVIFVAVLIEAAWHSVFGGGEHGRHPASHHVKSAVHSAVHSRPVGHSLLPWVIAALIVIVLATAFTESHHRKTRAKKSSTPIKSHRPAASAWLVLGAALAAVPSVVHYGSPIGRAAVSFVVLTICWGIAWFRAGEVKGGEPTWRRAAAAVPGWWWGGVLAGGLLVAWLMSARRVPGGDIGWVVGALVVQTHGAATERGRANMRDRIAAATSHEALQSVDQRGDVTVVTFAPQVLADKVRRHADTLSEALEGEGLQVEADLLARRITISPCAPLPGLAPMPTIVATGQRQLPIGVKRPDGSGDTIVAGGVACQEVVLDFDALPHGATLGTTGAGKSVELTVEATQALLRGWDLVIAEAVKGSVDFLPLRPWTRGFATTLEEIVSTIDDVLAELARRKAIIAKYGVVNVADLPENVRDLENCQPMMVIMDELFSTLAQSKSKSQQAMAINTLREMIGDGVSRLMREGRFVDIHLQVGMQRPDARVFEGEIKANIGFRILAGAADRIARSMALRDADNAPKIARGIKGRALIETDSEDATEVQLYYVAAADVPAILEAAGVPHAIAFHAPSTEAEEESPPAAPKPSRTRTRRAPRRDVPGDEARGTDAGVKVIVDKRAERFAQDVEPGVPVATTGDGSYRTVATRDPDEAA